MRAANGIDVKHSKYRLLKEWGKQKKQLYRRKKKGGTAPRNVRFLVPPNYNRRGGKGVVEVLVARITKKIEKTKTMAIDRYGVPHSNPEAGEAIDRCTCLP